MTTFSFSTGNPSNLTGGATASMTDISGSLTDVKTFLNAATITDTNVQAAGLTDTSLASPTNAVWRSVMNENFAVSSLSTTPSWMGGTVLLASGSAGNGLAQLYTPPTSSDIAVAGKTTRMRLRVCWATNATAPGITLTWGFYPVTSFAGGINNITPTFGTVLAGTTAALATPTGSNSGAVAGASFDFSGLAAATSWMIGVVGSGAQAANSLLIAQAILEMRHT